jgi:SpoVK/Ycf46/Vps4 family AAA+-type ATPase
VDRLPRPGKDRTKGTGLEGLRPTVKKLEPEQQDQVEVAGDEEREERVFNPAGYEAHLAETIEKDILQRHPDVTWTKVAGLHEAKAILQEAMVLPILMPDFFKVQCRTHILLSCLMCFRAWTTLYSSKSGLYASRSIL